MRYRLLLRRAQCGKISAALSDGNVISLLGEVTKEQAHQAMVGLAIMRGVREIEPRLSAPEGGMEPVMARINDTAGPRTLSRKLSIVTPTLTI